MFSFINAIVLTLYMSCAILNAESPIPHTAHFCYGLWDDNELPSFFEGTMLEWQKQGWDVHLWNREEVDLLLSKYPELDRLSSTFTRKVQKADLARYLIIYEHGGFYFDLDCRPQPVSLLCDLQDPICHAETIFFIECHITPEFSEESRHIPIRRGTAERLERIANFAFGSVQGSSVLWQTLELLKLRCESCSEYNGDYDILYKTGPDCLTECVHMARPFYRESQLWITEHDTYLEHFCAGTWRNDQDLK
jgi:hypothetical protein